MIAFMPEPHILLMVVAGTFFGMPAPSAAWRAGAWPSPADSTQPITTSWTSAAATFAAASAPWMAAAPSCGAVAGESTPWNAPMGVRRAAAMTTSDLSMRFSVIDSRSVATAQSSVEHIDESVGNFLRVEARVFAEPVAHPVERARQSERGHARIAVADRPVGHPRVDERAHALVDARLQQLDAAAHRRAEMLILGAQHAPPEVPDNSRRVPADEREQPFARGTGSGFAIRQARLDLREARLEAFEKDRFLVRYI